MWTRQEKAILWVTGANHFLVHTFEMGFPALVIPLAAHFDISLAAAIALSQGMYLAYGVGALPSGLLSDKWNMKYMICIGALGAGISSLLAAFSSSPLMLVISLTFIGLFISIYHPAGISLISHSVSQRGKALGFNGVFGNIGISSGPIIAGVCNYFWGWQSCFVVLGVISLTIGASASMVSAIPHRQSDDSPTGRKEEKQKAFYFIIVCITILFGGVLYRAATVSMPAFMEKYGPVIAGSLTDIKNNPLQNLAANAFMFVIYVGGIFGQVVGGHLSDKYDLRKVYLVFYLFLVPLALSISFLRGYWLIPAAMAYFFFQLGMQPVENSLIANFTPVRWRSTAFGLKFVLALGVGSIGVAIVGYIQGHHGFPLVFRLGSIYAALVSVIVFCLWTASRKISVTNKKG